MKKNFLPAILASVTCLLPTLAFSIDTSRLVWSDEFDQPLDSPPDSSRWVYDLGASGWGNNELQNYTDSTANASIVSDSAATDGKVLAIRALKTTGGGYTSARLKTLGKFTPRFGRIEARAKLPNGQGIWPAFWMLGSNIATAGWPACGEIDVIESINANPQKVYGTLHGPGYSGSQGLEGSVTLAIGTLDQAYHVYAVDWSTDKIVWSFDGAPYHTESASSIPSGTRWVFNDHPFFLILNLAVGGNWPGYPDQSTPFPQTFSIDYVRVYGSGPPPPAEVGALASGPTEVSLTWLPPSALDPKDVSGYRIERATDAAFTENRVHVDIGPVTAYTDASTNASTTYFYRVMALTTEGSSNPSETRAVETPAFGSAGTANFANISARAFCQRGNQVTIGGFVVTGSSPLRVLVRAVGPTLIDAGIPSSEALHDPVMKIYRGNTVVATNDDWISNANLTELLSTTARVGATPLSASDTTSSALLLTLPPAVYSFVTAGKSDTSGIVLIEAYDAH